MSEGRGNAAYRHARTRLLIGTVLLVVAGGIGIAWGLRGSEDPDVLRTVAVASNPQIVVIDLQGRAFVAGSNGRVSVLDAHTSDHLTAVAIGADPSAAIIDAGRGRAIICSRAAGLLSMLDTQRMQVIRRVPVGGTCPTDLAVDVRRGRVYVPTSLGVRVLAMPTGIVLRTVVLPAQTQAVAVAVDPRTGRAFVTGSGNTVSILNGRGAALVRTVTVGQNPGPVVVDASSGHVFVVNSGADSVSMLDARTGTVLRTVPVGAFPVALAVDGRTGRVFVVNQGGGGSVSTLDTTTGTVVATTPVGGTPLAVAVDARTGRVFVTGTATGVAGGVPHLSPFLDRLIVDVAGVWHSLRRQDTGHVSVLNAWSGALLYTVAVGQGPSAVAVSERTNQAFIANFNSNSVSVLNATR